MKKGLIIKKVWLDKIFDEGKVWEMRTTKTNIRGRIKLIESGSGLIMGEATIVDSFFPDVLNLVAHMDFHQVTDKSLLRKWSCAWILKDAKRYDKPIPYKHPQGAVIWVNL